MLKGLESTNKTYDVVAPFLYPVEELLKNIPDYGTIIKKPMDLHIIKAKLTEGEYEDVAQVDADVKLMIANAVKYNAAGDPVHIAANQLQQLWIEKLKSLPAKQASRESSEDPLGGSAYGADSDDENGRLMWSSELDRADWQMKTGSQGTRAKSLNSKARLPESGLSKLSVEPIDPKRKPKRPLLPSPENNRLPVPALPTVMVVLKRLESQKKAGTGMTMMMRCSSFLPVKRKLWRIRLATPNRISSTRLSRLLPEPRPSGM